MDIKFVRNLCLKLKLPVDVSTNIFEYTINDLHSLYQHLVLNPNRIRVNKSWTKFLNDNRVLVNSIPRITRDPYCMAARPVWPVTGDRRFLSDLVYFALRSDCTNVFDNPIIKKSIACTCDGDQHSARCCFVERFLIHAMRFTGHEGMHALARIYRPSDRFEKVSVALCYDIKRRERHH